MDGPLHRLSGSERLRAAAEELQQQASISIVETAETSTEQQSRLHPGGAGDSTATNSTVQHSHVSNILPSFSVFLL